MAGTPDQSRLEIGGEAAAMATPRIAQSRMRSSVRKTAITDRTSSARPMQFRMSTRKRSVHGLLSNENSQSCNRKANAAAKRYPERFTAAPSRAAEEKPFFS